METDAHPLRRTDDEHQRERLGAVARRFRQRADSGRGLPLRVIAQATGRSSTSVWRFEKGQSLPRDLEGFLRGYAGACGVRWETIWQEALGIKPAPTRRGFAHSPVGLPIGIVVSILTVLVIGVTAAFFNFTSVHLIVAAAEGLNVILASAGLVMALLIMPRAQGFGPVTKIGITVFSYGLAAAASYQVAIGVSGGMIDTRPVVLALRAIMGIGGWITIFGLIRTGAGSSAA